MIGISDVYGQLLKEIGKDIFHKPSRIIFSERGTCISSNEHPYAIPLKGINEEFGNFWYDFPKICNHFYLYIIGPLVLTSAIEDKENNCYDFIFEVTWDPKARVYNAREKKSSCAS